MFSLNGKGVVLTEKEFSRVFPGSCEDGNPNPYRYLCPERNKYEESRRAVAEVMSQRVIKSDFLKSL